MTYISDKLANEPIDWGEIYWSVNHVVVLRAAREFLAVVFAVDECKRLIVVKHYALLEGHPFGNQGTSENGGS